MTTKYAALLFVLIAGCSKQVEPMNPKTHVVLRVAEWRCSSTHEESRYCGKACWTSVKVCNKYEMRNFQ